MSYIEYKHYFTVDSNGNVRLENQQMYDHAISKIKHRGFFIIKNENADVQHKLYKFYFGVVIRKYCKGSNVFSVYTVEKIHEILFQDIRGSSVVINGNVRIVYDKPFDKYNHNDMKEYISEIIPHLAVEYGIHVKSNKDQYEYKK